MDILDQQRIRRSFRRAAPGYDAADFLHREVRARMLDRLALTRIEARQILDLGAGTGGAALELRRRYPEATIVNLDLVPAMLRAGSASIRVASGLAVCADAARLPFADANMDLIFSSLMLPWCPNPVAVLTEARRVIRFPGLFSFTTLGPDTLAELRSAWGDADGFSHVLPFMDMHDLGDVLLHAGFAEPVVDAERLTVTYADVSGLYADLRGIGSINATLDRNPGLTGAGSWARMQSVYEDHRDRDGRLPATLEIIYGQAWCAEPSARTGGSSEEFEIPIDRLSRGYRDRGS